MKLGKLSLVAVLALGTSAFAIDNVKVSGEAKLWYQTSETSGTTQTNNVAPNTIKNTNGLDFFDHNINSMAEATLVMGATMDLLPNLSAGISGVALTTLGLENNLVGMVPAARYDSTSANADDLDANALSDQAWVRELYLAYTMGKTTVKIGRQELATPLAFTEKWNVVDNTFEAAVVLNNDLPDTTLVGAWVGKHNSSIYLNTTVVQGGKFSTFGTDGAYAAGAINKSLPNTTIQAWYYDVVQVADAYWLQADTKVMGMVTLGAQYANMDPKASGVKTNDIFAVKAGVDVANSNFYAAYSAAGTGNGATNFSNVATGDKSMIYTALGSVYFDGENTTKADTDAWKIGASTKMVPGVGLSASYAEAETGDNAGTGTKADYNAWDIIATGNVGPLGLTAIYTEYEKESSTGTKLVDTDTFRVIASLKF
jgi:hypothetical protein